MAMHNGNSLTGATSRRFGTAKALLASTACLLFAACCSTAQSSVPVTVAAHGWTVAAEHETLTVTHEKLGVLMRGIRLWLRDEQGLHPLTGWSAEPSGPDRLSLRTALPRTGWVIELRPNVLKFSSTANGAALTAKVAAPPTRVPARLIDPQGTPVDWVGTNEVKSGYGGSETLNPSFLPRTNADVMYFSLGQVGSPAWHGLFDRPGDIAIEFPDDAVMLRDGGDANLLDLTLPIRGNAAIRLTPDYFTQALGVPYYVPFDDSYFKAAPMVWSSWTSYYEEVREEDMVRNTDWLATNLKPYGFQYVQLDDGYDRVKKGEHSWIEDWNKRTFPHGPEWLAAYIKSKGLRPGIWLVPNSYANATGTHPDWYLRDKRGNFLLDYSTPALDSTNPAVMQHLKRLFGTLGGWGYEYYKFDGEHALPRYAPPVDKTRLYDPKVDSLVNYRDRLKLIREVIGPKVFIEGCPAGTPLNGIGYFNSYFTGHDLYNNWQGMYPLFSSINANAFLNHLVVYVMPGEGLELGLPATVGETAKKRPPIVIETARSREDPMTGFGVTLAEARTLVSYVALTGVAYPLASVMPELPAERVKLLKATMPTMPILPVDLFSRGTDAQWDKFKHVQPDFYVHNYPEILNVKVSAAAGVYDIVALTNWRSTDEVRSVDLKEKLGLAANRAYVVFDFWSQKELGVVRNTLKVKIEPHDTRVLFVQPLLGRPQLVGMSRHISGSFSLRNEAWEESKRTLRGTSETVAKDPYTLWIHLPDGVQVVHAKASSGGREIAVIQKLTGNSLMVRFEAQPAPVDWQIAFTSGTRN
ncbi:MAG: alpha-galactosidase [Bryobacteraceae bacterium]|nr:alpha-galactosidase [Bryobacteraceae bacterium]